MERVFPRLVMLIGSPNVASHAAVSSFQSVGCIVRIEMRGGRFAEINQANQRLPGFAGRAGLTIGILRQHFLANANLGESFTFHIFTDIDQITQIINT